MKDSNSTHKEDIKQDSSSPKILGHLDGPMVDAAELGKINTFSGWAFLSNGVAIDKVDVQYNGTVLGSCQYGLERVDVFQSYPNIKESKTSGFSGQIYIPGEVTAPVVVVIHDRSGSQYPAFKLDLQQVTFRQHIMGGSIDLAKLDSKLLVDAIYRSLMSAGNEPNLIPSMTMRSMVAGTSSILQFGIEGGQCLAYLKLLCDLKRSDRVLDIGCGCGRNAYALRGHISEYFGFDIVPGLIDQAQIFVRDNNFEFRHFDLYSKRYNPKPNAKKPENFQFPLPNESMDIAMLNSVFTHLLPAAFKNYVKEIGRILGEGGRCFATLFLRQNNQVMLGGKWSDIYNKSNLFIIEKETDKSFFSVTDISEPDKMVIYDLSYVNQIFESAGLFPKREVIYGRWNGFPEGLWYQDIIVYQKK